MKSVSVLTVNRYGSIHVKLKKTMEDRGLTRNALARAVNTRFEVIDRWCEGKIEKIDADILARLCYVLDCKIEDLLEYQEEK